MSVTHVALTTVAWGWTRGEHSVYLKYFPPITVIFYTSVCLINFELENLVFAVKIVHKDTFQPKSMNK